MPVILTKFGPISKIKALIFSFTSKNDEHLIYW